MLRRRVLGLVLLLSFAVPGLARADRTDDYVKAEMARQKIIGLSLVVLKDGRTIKVAGYGLADVKAGTPATPDTVYKIGSVSKQFIATGIMLLAQEGKLRVDDPVSKYLDGTPPAWSGITIRHFLTHTSGVVREAPAFAPFKPQPDLDVIRSAYALPLRFEPGAKWEYCNVGYFSLAEIIHKVSGKPWPDYISEYARFPDQHLTVVVLMNTDDADVRALAQGVALIHLEAEKAQTAGAR